MAIEKMVLLNIEGNIRKINKTLVKCCESNCFHMITESRASDGKGVTEAKHLSGKSPYDALVKRAAALAGGLGIELQKVEDYDDVPYSVSIDFSNYLKQLEERFNVLEKEKAELEQSLKDHSTALVQVEKIAGFDVDFEELYACKFVKLRFGKLPIDSLPKLEYYRDRDFVCYNFHTDDNYVWIFYLTPKDSASVVDSIFNSLYFERVRMPDYFRGNADDSKSAVLRLVKEENEKLDSVNSRIAAMCEEERQWFLKVYSKLKAINQSYGLRENVSVLGKKFFCSGYVPKRRLAQFRSDIEGLGDVIVTEQPADSDAGSAPPVMLRNNWLFRPFEMFVKMYGLPDYNGFDPTPYVAVTFMLIFGIMFGDVGQGLLITVLGIILDKWRKVKLAPVMQRIGITSAIFGVLYGSVFGNEELIEPFFKAPSVYGMLGMKEAPADIFQVSTLLLISAIAIGAILIIISMMMNIVTNFRNKNYADALISPSGVSGLVFYASLVAAAALQLGLGIPMFSTAYVLCLIVLPLLVLFLKEPIVHTFTKLSKKRTTCSPGALVHAVATYSNAVSDLGHVAPNRAFDVDDLMTCGSVKAQYGTVSIDGFEKLNEFEKHSFVFYPFESDGENVQGVFLCPDSEFAGLEDIFTAIGFKKLKMPDYVSDISKESSLYHSQAAAETKKKKSVGSFIIEGVIELFESCLTYVTNTMSFLRIGGFILSHAGLMLVVNILAGSPDGGASYIIVQIIGNLFVIGMEGFLVGIQVLRLEFYEIFSRFYKGNGKPFDPVTVRFEAE